MTAAGRARILRCPRADRSTWRVHREVGDIRRRLRGHPCRCSMVSKRSRGVLGRALSAPAPPAISSDDLGEPVVGLVHACRAPPETQSTAVTHTVERVRPRSPTQMTRRDGCDSPEVDVAAPRHARSADDALPAHATRSRATSTMMVFMIEVALWSTHLGRPFSPAPPSVSVGEHVALSHRERLTAGPPSAGQGERLSRRSMIERQR